MIDIMKQGLGAPHAPTRALRKLTRVEEFWWAVQDSNSTATPQAGQQNGPAPANSTKPGTFSGPKWLKKGSGSLFLHYFFVLVAIAFLFCNSPKHKNIFSAEDCQSATTTTAASGGNREELLGQRPARRKCHPRHDADAGCRNPIAEAISNRPAPKAFYFTTLANSAARAAFTERTALASGLMAVRS